MSVSFFQGKINVTVNHLVDGAPLVFDTVVYINAAQNQYGVEKLQYYISNIKLYKNKSLSYSDDNVFLLDARVDSTLTFSFTPASVLTPGTYDSMAFIIGLAPNLNNCLSASVELNLRYARKLSERFPGVSCTVQN